jgi:hypothetical protein
MGLGVFGESFYISWMVFLTAAVLLFQVIIDVYIRLKQPDSEVVQTTFTEAQGA